MSSFRSPSSNNGTQSSHSSSPEKKPSLPVRVIRWTVVQVVSFILTVLILGIGYAAVTWTNIPSGSGASGQPVNQTLVQGIINNINYLSGVLAAVDIRLDTLESGVTTGGTVTGPLRWSSEYSGQNYTQAWTTCLGLTPTGSWRIPSEDEIETGRHLNAGLFTGSKNYWSSSIINAGNPRAPLTWYPTGNAWGICFDTNTTSSAGCNYGSISQTGPMAFRCVSNVGS